MVFSIIDGVRAVLWKKRKPEILANDKRPQSYNNRQIWSEFKPPTSTLSLRFPYILSCWARESAKHTFPACRFQVKFDARCMIVSSVYVCCKNLLVDSLHKMSFTDVVANIAQCFEDENLERLEKINDHLKDRFSTLLQKPRKILRCSIDKNANEQ